MFLRLTFIRIDDLYTAIGNADIKVLADSEGVVSQLLASTIIVEDKILCQSRVTFSEIKVGIGHAIDNLCACRLHAWPSTIQVAYIASHIQSKCIPSGLIVYKHCKTIMLRLIGDLLYACIGNTQIQIASKGEIEVSQLQASTIIVEE